MTQGDRTTNDRTTMRWSDQQSDGPTGGASTGRGGSAGRPEGAVPDWQERLALRNWSLPVKLAAVLLVPTVFVVSLGVLRIVEQTERAQSYDGVQQAVALEDRTATLLADLASERTAAAVYVATRRAGPPAAVRERAEVSEASADAMREAANRADSLDEQARSAYNDAANGLQQLYRLRTEVQNGRVDAAGVVARYSEEINALLAFDRSLTREAADPSLAGLAGGLYALSVVREEDAYVQAVVAAGIAAGRIDAPSIDEARNATLRRTIAVDDFRAAVGTDDTQLADAVVGPDVDARDRLAQVVLGRGSAGLPLQVSGPEWQRASAAVTERVAETSEQLRGRLQGNAQALQDGARNAAGIASVVLLLALLAGAAVVFFVTRSLLRPLRLLRRTALDVAERRLPGAVRSLREGETPDTDVAATPIRTREEIGQVARAFDQVHEQAVRLAAEQAGLRSAFNSIFVNLSRRSQALVERQLRLIEQLENNEEDPEALSNLFQLDHLATRMRRNSENLLVLSGTDLSRRGTRPVPVVDVLRAAASEVEQYQRVDLASPPHVMLLGRTASDVVHLVAELLENATTFSAPDTRVDVVVNQTPDGGLVVDIADAGVGMTAGDLTDANTRLASPPTVDVSASRRMGLFVVGRLAIRHGIAVSLRGRDPVGLVASVVVPANAILAAVPGGGTRPAEAPNGVRGGNDGPATGSGAALGAAGAAVAASSASTSSSPSSSTPGTVPRQERPSGRPALPSRGEREGAAPATTGASATSFFDPGASRTGSGTPAAATGDESRTNGSGGTNGELPKRGPRGVLGSLPTRNGRRFPPPGSTDAPGSSGDGDGDGGEADHARPTNGTGPHATAPGRAPAGSAPADAAPTTNGHGPATRGPATGAPATDGQAGPTPADRRDGSGDDRGNRARGSLAPVEEIPPPAAGPAPTARGDEDPADDLVDGPTDEDDDADERVASRPDDADDGVTVWRAPGRGEQGEGADDASSDDASSDGEGGRDGSAPAGPGPDGPGRHGWRRTPPQGSPVVPSGNPQHRMAPPGGRPQGAPPAGRPGGHPQPPYPPPPGWAPRPAGPPPARRGPAPVGVDGQDGPDRPAEGRPTGTPGVTTSPAAPTGVAPAAPGREDVDRTGSPHTGRGAAAVAGTAAAAAGVLGALGARRAARADAETAAGTATAGTTEAPSTDAPSTDAPSTGTGTGGAEAAATPTATPTPEEVRAVRRARAMPMTVRRSAVPLAPREAGDEPSAPDRAATGQPGTQQPAAPQTTGTPVAGSSAATGLAGPAGPDAGTDGDDERAPRPLARRRGPSGGPMPVAGSTPRMRPRRSDAGDDRPGGSADAEDGLFRGTEDEQPAATAPSLPRRGPGAPPGVTGNGANGNGANGNGANGNGANGNGAARVNGGPAGAAPPRAVPERLPLRSGTVGRERTPIFDEVASVWFREGTPGDQQAEEWRTSGDAGWRAAAASTEATDGGTTEAGLPRRRPRARLIPGAAEESSNAPRTGSVPAARAVTADAPSAEGSGAPRLPRRNADAVRGRLASYQRGVSEGRGSRQGLPDNGDAASGDRPGHEEEQ